MTIGLDIDGVLRNFAEAVCRAYRNCYPWHEIKLWEHWDLSKMFPIGEQIHDFIWLEHPVEVFAEARPYEGALEMVDALITEGHAIEFVTTQPPSSRTPTRRWLYERGMWDKGVVIFVMGDESKGGVGEYDILLDDGIHNLEAVLEAGRRAVCMARPWNMAWDGEKVHNYEEFLDLVREASRGDCQPA